MGFSKESGRKPQTTKLRWDDPAQSRVAHDLLARARDEERFTGSDRMKFSQWVPKFISERYGRHALNLKTYTNRWRALSPFLGERKIDSPSALTAEACWDYILWRTSNACRSAGIRTACKNTALEELKFLRMLLKHAVAIGYATRNPMDSLRFRWEDQREKPEFDEDHLPIIWKELQAEPEWMRRAFTIAYHTGCRISETALPMNRVSITRREIDFRGKGNRPFVVPMPDALAGLFSVLKARLKPDEHAVDLPNTATISFHHFFKRLGLPYCFHCCRVSFISRCIRAGLPEAVTMRLVNHSSVLISRLYQRYRAVDLRRAVESIPHALPAVIESTGGASATA